MLGYLLTPGQTHGLGDTFLRLFLAAIEEASGHLGRFANVTDTARAIRADVFLESPYELGGSRRVVDVDIRVFSRSVAAGAGGTEESELHRIIIENKVKAQAARGSQLRDEFLAVLEDVADDESVTITMVFLTPPGDSVLLAAAFGGLDSQLSGLHRKAWLRWAGDGEDRTHVVALLLDLLNRESRAQIAPIADYLRHTIKAFIRHIRESPAGTSGRSMTPRNSPELDDIVEVLTVPVGSTLYQFERYESTTIRVLDLNQQAYVVAKPVLRKVNQVMELGINLSRPTGRSKNTRTLGREVMRALLEQSKADLST